MLASFFNHKQSHDYRNILERLLGLKSAKQRSGALRNRKEAINHYPQRCLADNEITHFFIGNP